MIDNLLKRVLNIFKAMPMQNKASFWFVICSFLQKGISELTTSIFTRLLHSTDYGQFTVFFSWLDMCSFFVTLRFFYGVFVHDLVVIDGDKRAFASSMQGLELTLRLALTIIYLFVRDFWNGVFGLTTVQMLCMLVSIWALSAFRFGTDEKRNGIRYKAFVLVTISASILKLVLGTILVANSEDKATSRILILILVEYIVNSWLFFIQITKGKTFPSGKIWKHSLMFAIPMIPHYLSQTVLNGADRLIIRDMIGLNEASIYGLAYSISHEQ